MITTETVAAALRTIANNIDCGNSTMTEDEEMEFIDLLKSISEPRISKYQACRLLGVSRSTFDEMVRDGKIPRGTKQAGFKELSWKKSDIQKYVTERK